MIGGDMPQNLVEHVLIGRTGEHPVAAGNDAVADESLQRCSVTTNESTPPPVTSGVNNEIAITRNPGSTLTQNRAGNCDPSAGKPGQPHSLRQAHLSPTPGAEGPAGGCHWTVANRTACQPLSTRGSTAGIPPHSHWTP